MDRRADHGGGGRPSVRSMLDAETPYAIPSAPSITCATNPASTNQRKWLSISIAKTSKMSDLVAALTV